MRSWENCRGTDLTLANYFSPSWADADRRPPDEIGNAMKEFIGRNAGLVAPTEFSANEPKAKLPTLVTRILGKGEPLMLMPLRFGAIPVAAVN